MSGLDNEELIDYEDDVVTTNAAAPAATNGAPAKTAGAEDGTDKKNFSGIHSTGFRCEYLTRTVNINMLTRLTGTSC
jgi:ATP-dependent RNA helicase UAP56/SUB2